MIEYTVTRYYAHLFTQFERSAYSAFVIRQKTDKPWYERYLREKAGTLGDRDIDATLDRGYEEFCRDVTERVMREHGGQVVLNRCPKCHHIVLTPRAKQCLWCYHDWHGIDA